MTGRRNIKKAAVRQRLYNAALHRFRSDGYEATSVAAICKDAGVAKGTFFNHFPNKADILAVWYTDAMAMADKAQEEVRDLTFRDALINRPLFAVSLTADDPDLWRAKHAYAPLSEAIQTAETNADNVVRARTLNVLQTAVVDGDVRPDCNLPEITELYLSVLTGTIREWLNTGGHFDLQEALTNRVETLIDLIST